jgi:hypothetical protein
MGYSAYKISPYSTPKEEVEKMFPANSITAMSVRGNKKDKQFYLAVNEHGNVSAYIVLVNLEEIDNTNFCYKILHESEGPYASQCPKSILKLLSPTTNEYALKWRNSQNLS